MKAIAIIPARGGSKRIPKKNIRDFCGKPIIAYSIEAAINSKIFDEIMVSTDDPEIAEIAEYYGAKVPFMRSAENSGDYATTADVLIEVLNKYQSELGKEFDYFACIYPTAPFITSGKIKEAFGGLINKKASSTLTVTKFSFPPQRAMIIENEHARYQFPENEKARSQDLQPLYHDCGQFYACRTSDFLSSKTLIMKNTVAFEVPEEETQDIDNYSDWNIAEIKFKIMSEKE